jgi:hypothetical protein
MRVDKTSQRENLLNSKITTKDSHTSLPRTRSHNGPTNRRNKSKQVAKQKTAFTAVRVPPGIEASRRAQILSPPTEPPVLVLWLSQVTRRFCGELWQTPRVDSGVSRYPALAHVHDFILLFLPPCSPHLSRSAIRYIELSLLVSPLLRGPARIRPFAPALHLHQRKSSRNLHLQYSAKSQSTPHCQSLITPGSDHPPVLRRFSPQYSGPLANYIFSCNLKCSYFLFKFWMLNVAMSWDRMSMFF